MFEMLLRLLLLAAFLLGWCLWLFRVLKLPAEQTPIVAISTLTVIMYFAGLLNIFTPVQAVLYLGGIAAGLYSLWVGRKDLLRRFFTLPLLCFGASGVWFLFLCRGASMKGHDNFAHWAIMAKSILTNNHLPNYLNTAVEYVGYPPATALWIKLVCNLLGTSDGTMIFAHLLLCMACIVALVPVCRRNLPGTVALAVFGLFAFLLYNGPCSLMVDYLLPLLTLACAAILVPAQQRDIRLTAGAVLPLLCFTAIVKNSGLIFCAAGMAMMLWMLFCGGQKNLLSLKGKLCWGGAAVLSPVFVWALWNAHTSLVYPDGGLSKHAVSTENYAQQLSEKSPEDIAQFQQMFFDYWFHWEKDIVPMFWITVLLCIAVPFFLAAVRRIRWKRALLYSGACLVSLLAYLVGLWGTYLFSMNLGEMLVLASLARYTSSFLSVLLGLMLMALLWHFREHKWRLPVSCAAALCCVFMLVFGNMVSFSCLYDRAAYQDDSVLAPWIELRTEYGLPECASYLIYTNGSPVDGWADRFVARYAFNSDVLEFWQLRDDAPDLAAAFAEYDYVVFKSPDELSDAELERWGFDPATTPYLDKGTFIARMEEMSVAEQQS